MANEPLDVRKSLRISKPMDQELIAEAKERGFRDQCELIRQIVREHQDRRRARG